MKCPKCNAEKTCVVGTRKEYRERKCPDCGHRFKTVEILYHHVQYGSRLKRA